MEISSSSFPLLFRVAYDISLKGHCRLILPFMLLENYFDSSTIEQCEQLWNVLVTMQKEIQTLVSKSSNNGFSILNIVNSLLRRTSKVKDGPFRGSVMM